MFKQVAIAAIVASAFVALPASAATTVTYTNGQNIVLTSNDGQNFSGDFGADIIGDGVGGSVGDRSNFFTEFFFTVPGAGNVAIAAISIRTSDMNNINFRNGFLNGTVPFTIDNGRIDIADLAGSITGGQNSFTLNGRINPPTGMGAGSFGGDVSFTLAGVPEPTTWALFILGFGMIGGALRRRSSSVRVSKAKLNFA